MALVEKAAQEICRRGMQTPAIIALEMHKPLAGILAQTSIITAPMIVPFVGFDRFNDYSRLLSKRENIELLLVKIEELCRTDAEVTPAAKG